MVNFGRACHDWVREEEKKKTDETASKGTAEPALRGWSPSVGEEMDEEEAEEAAREQLEDQQSPSALRAGAAEPEPDDISPLRKVIARNHTPPEVEGAPADFGGAARSAAASVHVTDIQWTSASPAPGDPPSATATPKRKSAEKGPQIIKSPSDVRHGFAPRAASPARTASPEGEQPRKSKRISEVLVEILDTDDDGRLTWKDIRSAPIVLKRHFKLPILTVFSWMRFLDVYFRFLFPLAYVPFVIAMFAQVNFGQDWAAKRALSSCS